MRYLITGTPRSRSAWLAAVITAHGSMCHHDALAYNIALNRDAGISDPGLGCLYPESAIAACRGEIVYVYRPDWLQAFERWAEVKLTPEFVAKCEQNLGVMRTAATMVLRMEDLQRDAVVAEVVRRCTLLPPSLSIIRMFQQLNIQEHRPKAQSALAGSASRSDTCETP